MFVEKFVAYFSEGYVKFSVKISEILTSSINKTLICNDTYSEFSEIVEVLQVC